MELSRSTSIQWHLSSFALLTIATCIAVVVRGQVCQQSLPPQYVPEDDTESTQQSSADTLYVYPNAFNSTQCLGRVTRLQYSFCYLRTSEMGGPPPEVFTVLLLGNGSNSYTVLNSYTEREDRDCAQRDETCCKTVDVDLETELSVQRNFALGFFIPIDTNSNFLYEAENEESLGFTVSPAGLPSITSVGSMINKSSLGQSPSLINNRRFSITFETQTATTTAGSDMMATTNINQATGRSTNSGGAVAAGVIVTLLVIGGAAAVVIAVVVIVLRKRKLKSSSVQATSPRHLGAFENQLYETDLDLNTINGRPLSSDNGVHDYTLPSSNRTDEVYEDMDQGEQPYEIPTTDSIRISTRTSRGASLPLPPVSGIDPYGTFSSSSTGRHTLNPMTLVSKGKSGYIHEEEPIYQDPAESEAELYAQYEYLNVAIIQRKEISIGDVLGEGQFGVVYLGKRAKPGEEKGVPVAIKTLKEGAREEDKVKFLQEAAIIGQFSHPNVVKLHGIVTGEEKMIVLELLQGGDLHHALLALNQGPEIDAKLDTDLPHTLLSYCRQVASGMAYLSQKGFVHRDLAARNILLSEDCECKITDFGMSRDLAHTDYYVSHGGKVPVRWTAPEAINYKKYSTASDVWSFGCVMYEIWSLGHKPFGTYSNSECVRLIDEGVRLPPPPGCPRSIYALMMDCWHPSASSRPDFVSVVQQLSLPDTKLLKWSEEDKAIDPEAATLGAGLDQSVNLYKDLQERYIDTQIIN